MKNKTYIMPLLNMLQRTCVFFLFCLLAYIPAQASHIYGADLFYTHVSGNTYTITLNAYGDCGSGSVFNSLSSASAEVLRYNGNTLVARDTLLIQSPTGGVEVTPVCPSQINNTRCKVTTSSIPGVMKFVYAKTITLSGTSANWRFRFTGEMVPTQAGRTNSMTNILVNVTNPSVMNLEATLNNTSAANSSPTYTTIPTPFFCINKAASYNPGAIDPNTDSLDYQLVSGLTATGVVTYLTGYSATSPLAAATGSFGASNSTGQVNFTPNLVQQSLVVHKVSEYRNGVLVGTSMREMTFVVLNNCSNNPPGGKITNNNAGKIDVSGNIIQVCKSAGTVTFNINATDADLHNITVSASGLPAGATYTVTNNGGTTPIGAFSWNVSNVAPGSYNFFITFTDDGCPLSSKQTVAYTVIVLPVPSIAFAITQPATCVSKAIFTMTPSVTPSPWRIQVMQGATTLHNFTNITGVQTDSLSPGSYVLRVTNADTCFKDTAIVIPPPPAIGVSLAITPVTCNNANDAKVVVTASDGKPSYTYTVDGGTLTSNNTFTNQTSGYHTYRIKDANQCVKDTLVQILNPQKVGADIVIKKPPCNFFNSGEIVVTGKNTIAPYTYALGAGAYSSNGTFTSLFSGSHTIHVKDKNNCVLDTVVVLPDSIKVDATIAITHILCNSDSTGSVILNATGGTAPYKYQLLPGTAAANNTFLNLKANTYSFHIEDTNKCYLDTILTLNQPPKLDANIAVTNTLCYGDNTGTVNLTGTGGVNPYTYSLGSGGYGATTLFTGLASGAYTFHIKDNNGCIRDTNIIVDQPAQLSFATMQVTNVLCNGAATGQVTYTATGGVNPYTYAMNAGAYSSSNTYSALSATQYIFRIKDNNNCTKDTTINITQPTRITPQVTIKRSTCTPLDNGAILLNATGGVPGYTYAIGTSAYSSLNSFTSLPTGSYTLHVKDQNQCIKDTVVNVGDSLIINISTNITNALCYDSASGIINISAGGGVPQYKYALDAGSYGNISAFGGLKADTYLVRVIDNIGCTGAVNATVNQPSRIVPSLIVTEPSCFGYNDGNIVVSAIGGTPGYEMTIDNRQPVTIGTLNNIAAGTRTVSVIDINGCWLDTTIKINEPKSMLFKLEVKNLRCNGDTSGTILIDGTGGTPPFMYAYDQQPFVAQPILISVKAGSRVIKMRDAKGCIKDTTVVLTEPAPLLITSPLIVNPTCEGYPDGSVKVYGNGGVQPYSYRANSEAYNSSNFMDGLKEGVNVISIKDANNCTYDTTIILEGYPHIIFDDIQAIPVNCYSGNDGKIIINASGGIQPLAYNLEGKQPGTNPVIDSLSAGKYIIRITDSAGCIKDSAVTIESPDKIEITTKTTPNDCEGFDDGGSLEADVTGGTPGYSYTWSTQPEQYNYRISGIPNGSYKVIITDANNCTDSAVALVEYDNCCKLFIPDAFTPNRDGLNDIMRVRFKGDFELKVFAIYNRFGERVFQTSNMQDGWNGMYKGTNADIGTYNYYVEGMCGNGGKKEVFQKGTITLIR